VNAGTTSSGAIRVGTAADVAAAVRSAIGQVLVDTGRQPVSIERAMLLGTDIGLDSLDLAQTIVLLERSLGVDPFRGTSGARPSLRSVGDLIDAYASALVPARRDGGA
jgi:acyl carrier protein